MITPRSFLSAGLLVLALTGSAAAEVQPPVVVELFTSQGCSSCPPADAYLGELAQRPGVLALAFHIDYWNYIGWTDPFARPWASARQRGYMESLHLPYVYTPQIVVEGAAQAIGSERATIETMIRAAAQARLPAPVLSLARGGDGALTVTVGAGHAPAAGTTLWLVGYDPRHATEVLHGENRGRKLIDYNAVRTLRRIGAWTGAPLTLTLPATPGEKSSAMAVLLQENATGPILTAATLPGPS